MEKTIAVLEALTELSPEEGQLVEFLKAIVTEDNAEVICTHIQSDGKKALRQIYDEMKGYAHKKSKGVCVMVTGREAADIVAKLWCVPVDGKERVTAPAPAKKSVFKRRSLD